MSEARLSEHHSLDECLHLIYFHHVIQTKTCFLAECTCMDIRLVALASHLLSVRLSMFNCCRDLRLYTDKISLDEEHNLPASFSGLTQLTSLALEDMLPCTAFHPIVGLTRLERLWICIEDLEDGQTFLSERLFALPRLTGLTVLRPHRSRLYRRESLEVGCHATPAKFHLLDHIFFCASV